MRRSTPLLKVCPECDGTFDAWSGNARFCSKRCGQGAWSRTHRRRAARSLACRRCGRGFSATSGPAAYCSRRCKQHAGHAATHSARRARLRAAAGRFTPSEWLALVDEWSGLCAYCGMARPLTADHRIPLSRGGTNDIGNILPACRPCNASKGRLTEGEYRAARIAAAARAA